jgi:hypothetical protein
MRSPSRGNGRLKPITSTVYADHQYGVRSGGEKKDEFKVPRCVLAMRRTSATAVSEDAFFTCTLRKKVAQPG